MASVFAANAQISNRMLPAQNYLQNVNPDNVMFTSPPNDNRFWVANRNALVFNFNQVLGIKDTILTIGDVRYKGIAWLPSWPNDILGVPSVFPTNIANVSGLQAALDGKQPTGSYLTTEVDPTVPAYVKSITSSNINTWNNPTYAALPDKPTIPTNNNQLTNGAGYITGISSANIISALGYTPYNTSNPNGYISSISASDVNTALGYTPYNASNPSSFISRTGISAGSGINYNSSTGVITNSSPDQTVTISSGDGISVLGTYPNFTIVAAPSTRVFNNNVSRSLNSPFVISTTRDVSVSYSISLSVTNPLLAGSSTANAFLEYSTDGGSTWVTVSNSTNASSVALTVTLAITQPSTFVVSGIIPANASVRIRTTTSGTATATYSRGQEVLL